MAHYVVGFCIDIGYDAVILIQKTRPEWQRGRLNGVGGGVERGESAHAAMVREFTEETGLFIASWKHFADMMTLRGDRVDFFVTLRDMATMPMPTSNTDETVTIVNISNLSAKDTLPNVPWLIQMGLSTIVAGKETTRLFHVIESE